MVLALDGEVGQRLATVRGSSVSADVTLKDRYAGYAFQHEPIAAYFSLKVARKRPVAGWIDETIAEERAAMAEAETMIATVTHLFIDRNGK